MSRNRVGLLVLVGVALMGGLFYWWMQRRTLDQRQMLAYLPRDVSTTFFVDLATLRRAGQLKVLTDQTTPEDQEYRDFVKATGFEYGRDLDQVAGSLRFEERFYVAQGRFDLTKLRSYAASQKGKCDELGCEVQQAVSPTGISRTLLFRELRPGLLGMVVTDKPRIWPLAFGTLPTSAETSGDPVWVRTTGQEAAGSPLWPRALGFAVAESLGRARTVFFGAGLSAAGPRLRVEAKYGDAKAATSANALLKRVFDLLKNDAKVQKDTSGLTRSLMKAKVEQTGADVVAEFPLYF